MRENTEPSTPMSLIIARNLVEVASLTVNSVDRMVGDHALHFSSYDKIRIDSNS